MSQTHVTRNETVRAILTYLIEHEGAADTLEGIARWWILNEDLKRKMALIEDSLEYLLARGVLKKRLLPGSSNILYYVEKGEIERVQKILNEMN